MRDSVLVDIVNHDPDGWSANPADNVTDSDYRTFHNWIIRKYGMATYYAYFAKWEE